MRKYGLIGEHLGHSYSPTIHKKFGNYSYDLCEVQEEELESLIHSEKYQGFNVTIPYKKKVMEFCDKLSPEAQSIGSVNTMIKKDNQVIGHNTDYDGFQYLLEKNTINPINKKCLVLGSGGASLTVEAVLRRMGASEVVVISRSGENNYKNIAKHYNAQVIVNTTPVGMYPNNGDSPLDLTPFKECVGVVDLIYNPYRTKLVLEGLRRFIPSVGGLEMLVVQGKKASELFQDKTIQDDFLQKSIEEIKQEMLNIILIGMPGAGKTTVGRRMALRENKTFLDMDELIEKKFSMSISDFFKKYGEEKFREIETEILEEISKKSGHVIATGGGIVTRDENYDLIKQNGIVIWLQRELNHLPIAGRPLSKEKSVEKLYEERRERYEAWSDFSIYNEEEKK